MLRSEVARLQADSRRLALLHESSQRDAAGQHLQVCTQ